MNSNKIFTTLFLLFFYVYSFKAQTKEQIKDIIKDYNFTEIAKLQDNLNQKEVERQQRISTFLDRNPSAKRIIIEGTKISVIRDIDENGIPLYYTNDNDGSSKSIKANSLYNGGSLGLDVQGENMTVGIWEVGGIARRTHLDLGTNRTVVIDGTAATAFHATHVTGTIMSTGANSSILLGRGIAFESNARLANSTNDTGEMNIQASTQGLLVSNHSYGYIAGNLPLWRFGAYDNESNGVDLVCALNTNYLPVIAAGNDRNDGINSSKGGFDLITGQGAAKNSLTVAAVNQVLNYTSPSSVVMSTFSNWGPTDDGRIKPEISAKGVNTFSTSNTSDTAYGNSSGTSMAAPAISGLVLLLQEHYNNLNSSFMRAATSKGLVLHTASEAGSTLGPDYRFGWGLANGEDAAQLISDNNATDEDAYIDEASLDNGGSRTIQVTATGGEPLKVSISWTDPAGTAVNGVIDSTTPVLVNDLDLSLERNGTTYYPWKLNVASPISAATRNSTNDVDNFERVDIDSPSAGEIYNINISHKGTLSSAQNYSVIVSGGTVGNLSTVNPNRLSKQISIYPNPTSDVLNIASKDASTNIELVNVYDVSGRLVIATKEEKINVQSLSSGTYLVEIRTNKGTVTDKFIKR